MNTHFDDFIQDEKDKMNWFDKLVKNYPNVKKTSAFGITQSYVPKEEKTVLRPAMIFKFAAMLMLAFITPFMLATYGLLQDKDQFRQGIMLFFFLIFATVFFVIIRNAFFNKKYHYTITVDRTGISINNEHFFWRDISDTAIMYKQEGKRRIKYLVILSRYGEVKTTSLKAFWISDEKLSTIIEHYKADGIKSHTANG